MTPEEIASKEAADAAAKAATDAAAAKAAEEAAKANPDPLKAELEKVKSKKTGKTELEKALFTKQQLDKRIKELEGESGVTTPIDEDDDKPVTHGDLKKRELELAQKTALSLADEIENDVERELTKHHLVSTVRPSGNAQEDLRNARAIVNSVKNQHIVEELNRKNTAKGASSAAGAPAKQDLDNFEATAEEQVYMRAPFNLSKEQIIAARPK